MTPKRRALNLSVIFTVKLKGKEKYCLKTELVMKNKQTIAGNVRLTILWAYPHS